MSVVSDRVFPAVLLLILLLYFVIGPQLYVRWQHQSDLRHGLDDLPLKPAPNGLYYIDFSIGTPPQWFCGIFDTGASLSWVADNSCRQDKFKLRYDQTASSTQLDIGRAVHKRYRTGEWIKARLSSDHFRMGSLIVTNVFFGRVVDTNCDAGSGALLAMSPRHYESCIIDSVVLTRRLVHNNFAWINTDIGPRLQFSRLKPPSSVEFVKCVNERWILPCVVAMLGVEEYVEALVDTASTHIFLPNEQLELIKSIPDVVVDNKTGMLSSSSPHMLPVIKIRVGAQTTINLPPSSYLRDGNVLLSGFSRNQFTSSPYSAILGLPFILNVGEIIFDFETVSIGFVY